ncbi:hypothetical protein CR159_11825 [Pollutimonas subterranea]|uniref:DUF1232 domain-containing protein n=1 Tax=Pollutimonas subterranea TaxID=2045210 RepID=A0A2N4U3P0_9BURK|nr:YkvA family protein [Pollutimonas subterranea]PLC49613.1 hypothetical protein CR159_11825 [Pollutimonas subterranea]
MTLLETLRAWAHRLKRDGVTLWFAYRHPNTPLLAKALCVIVVAYALSPIDLIPDFIPVLGYLDDVILLPMLIWPAIQLVPEQVLAECRLKAAEWMEREGRKPRSQWGVVFVVVVWAAVAWAVWHYAIEPFRGL